MNMTAMLSQRNKIDENEISSRIEILENGKIKYMKKGYGWVVSNKPLYSVKLELMVDSSGLSQQEFGKKAGVTQPTLSRMISGKITSKSSLVDIATSFHVHTEWLLCLDEKPQPKLIDNILSLNSDDFVIVTRYTKSNNSDENTENHDQKSSLMIHTSLIKYVNFESLRFITQNDRSMSPDIKPGAAVVFNLNNQTIENGEMYAVEMANQICVRTIFTDLNGDLIIRAKMSDYPEHTVHAKDPNVKVLGRVITVTNTY